MEDKAKQEPKPEYKSVYCKYMYSQEELRDIAEELAVKTQDLDSLEDEKKSIASSYKERIERVALEVKTAARKYKDAYEMRNIECLVERDFDEGVIKYIRTDNGELADTRKMTMADRQMKIDDAIEKAEKTAGETEESMQAAAKQSKTTRLMAGEKGVIQ